MARGDSTFWISQTKQKLLRTACRILRFCALRVRFCVAESRADSAFLRVRFCGIVESRAESNVDSTPLPRLVN